jgi:hypothetical protein
LSLTCFQCPAGKYCPASTNAADVDASGNKLHPTSVMCPAGYYCPAGTEDYTPNACPIGYYNPFLGGSSQASCYHCPEGQMCLATGLSAPTGPCVAGTYCSSDNSGPVNCPAGTYCPAGASYPTNCPLGTYNPNTASTSLAACVGCDTNYYCGDRGISSLLAAGYCGSGFLCNPTGDTALGAMYPYPSPNQHGDFCPIGQYCT